jgi:hypothetical protein
MTKRRRTLSAGVLASAIIAVALTLNACNGKDFPTCYAGEYAACQCADGASGFQVCAASQDRYDSCVCDGRVPGLDASLPDGGDAEADAPVTGNVAVGQPCTSGTDCVTGVCFAGGTRSFCTIKCINGSCPNPPYTSGCNMQNFCKP